MPPVRRILWKEYEAGDTIIVDVGPNEGTGEEDIVFKKADAEAAPAD